MKKIFFEIIHNCIAHPLLSVCLVIDFMIAVCIWIPVAALSVILKWETPDDQTTKALIILFGDGWTMIFAEKFHDWTARHFEDENNTY